MKRIPGLLCFRIVDNPRANSSSVLLVDLDPSFTDYAVSPPPDWMVAAVTPLAPQYPVVIHPSMWPRKPSNSPLLVGMWSRIYICKRHVPSTGHAQECRCRSGYRYSREGGQPPKCTRIPPIRWQIWGPCIVVWVVLMGVVLRYFWAMMRFNAGSLYAVSSRLEPPGERALPASTSAAISTHCARRQAAFTGLFNFVVPAVRAWQHAM